MNINTYMNYEIEMIINQSLYEKKIINDDLYRKIKDILLKQIKNSKSK